MKTSPNDVVGLLINNAMHFLESASSDLEEYAGKVPLHTTNRELVAQQEDHRNALVFVAAGVELILKAKLATVHWSQIFSNPGEASLSELENQTFESIQASKLCKRIQHLTGEKFDTRTPSGVFQDRNATVHFYPPKDNAVKAKVLRGLNFSIEFTARNLTPALSGTDLGLASDLLSRLQVKASSLESLRDNRLSELEPELNRKSLVTRCPACTQLALVMSEVNDKRDFECFFCFESFDRNKFAPIYEATFLKQLHGLFEEESTEVIECFSCESETLLLSVEVRNRPKITKICTSCLLSLSDEDVTQCQTCGESFETDGSPVCRDHWSRHDNPFT